MTYRELIKQLAEVPATALDETVVVYIPGDQNEDARVANITLHDANNNQCEDCPQLKEGQLVLIAG